MVAPLVAIETQLLRVPLHTPFVTALRRTEHAETLVLRITDADGVTGWGEAPQVWRVTGDSLAGSRACLEGPLRDVLLGVTSLTAALTAVQRAVVGNAAAKMAADVALHDLAARRAGVTLADHLVAYAGTRPDHGVISPPGSAGGPPGAVVGGSGGAVSAGSAGVAPDGLSGAVVGGSGGAVSAGSAVLAPDGLPGEVAGASTDVLTDVTLSAGSAEELAEAARARVVSGFGTIKIKVGTDPDEDAARVRAVREAVGPDVVVRLDANQGWDAHQAVEILREVADLGIELLEQPVPRRDVLGLAHVRRHARGLGVPVMADETVFDLDDLVEVIRHDAADSVNVKLAKCGGLTPALELVRVARLHGVQVTVGCMMESHLGIGAAAALVRAAGLTDRVHDLDAGWWAAGSPYVGGVTYDRDRLVPADGPGLAITGLAG